MFRRPRFPASAHCIRNTRLHARPDFNNRWRPRRDNYWWLFSRPRHGYSWRESLPTAPSNTIVIPFAPLVPPSCRHFGVPEGWRLFAPVWWVCEIARVDIVRRLGFWWCVGDRVSWRRREIINITRGDG